MERNRGKSASPLIQTRGVAKSTASLVKPQSVSREEPDILEPRTKKASSSIGNIKTIAAQSQNQSSFTVSEDGSEQGVSRYSLRSLHSTKPRPGSKSVESSEKLMDWDFPMDSSLAVIGASPMVRSRSTFSIHLNSFALAESRLKAIGSAASLDNPRETLQATRSTFFNSADNLLSEEGFLRDIQLKGFAGIWSHAATRFADNSDTRLYFLMYLIWKGQENLFVIM